jgi:hypothetical protein
MTNIEDEVVSMKIENRTFLDGVTQTINALTKLRDSMNIGSGATKGIGDVQSAMNKVSAAPVVDQASGISKAFVAASAVAVTAIATITYQALQAGGQLANMFTGAPIKQGFQEYETNLNSIQTVLANTGLEGQKGLDTVNEALQQLNAYSDKTIYNFSEYRQPGRDLWIVLGSGFHGDVPALAGACHRQRQADGLELGRQRRNGWQGLPGEPEGDRSCPRCRG